MTKNIDIGDIIVFGVNWHKLQITYVGKFKPPIIHCGNKYIVKSIENFKFTLYGIENNDNIVLETNYNNLPIMLIQHEENKETFDSYFSVLKG